MKRLIFLIVSVIALTSCSHKVGSTSENTASDTIGITNEERGCREVTKKYGGKCNYYTEVDEKRNLLDIELSESDSIDPKQKSNIVLPIALLVCGHLNQKDFGKYDKMRLVLVYPDKHKDAIDYDMHDLQGVKTVMPQINTALRYVKNNQMDSLKSLFKDTMLTSGRWEKISSEMKDSSTQLGTVQRFQPMGFCFDDSLISGRVIFQIYGTLHGNKKTQRFCVGFDCDDRSGRIWSLQHYYPKGAHLYWMIIDAPAN